MIHRLCAPLAAAIVLAGLAAPAPAQTAPIQPASPRAIAGEWRASKIAGVDSLPSPAPTLRLGAREYVGGDGCNHIGGRLARAEAGRIEFGAAIATKMACEPAIMMAAMAFHRALKAARIYRVEGETLQIADARGDVVLTLERAK